MQVLEQVYYSICLCLHETGQGQSTKCQADLNINYVTFRMKCLVRFQKQITCIQHRLFIPSSSSPPTDFFYRLIKIAQSQHTWISSTFSYYAASDNGCCLLVQHSGTASFSSNCIQGKLCSKNECNSCCERAASFTFTRLIINGCCMRYCPG